VTRWFCLTKASVSFGTRRLVLGLATITVAAIALPARADAYIYTVDEGTEDIWRTYPDGNFSSGGFIRNPCCNSGVAVDSAHIYWTSNDGTIGRANLDGTNVNQNFITGAEFPGAVAVNDRFIYWTNSFGSIGRARLNGSAINQNFIASLGLAYGLAIDDKHIYWTYPGSSAVSPAIGRANLNGRAVNPSFITGTFDDIAWYGVTVDSNYLYWTNTFDRSTPSELGTTINRASLGGTGVERGFITGARAPAGVAVDATHIYWTNAPDAAHPTTPAIGRANLDGTQVDQDFVELLAPPGLDFCCLAQMAIDALPAACAGTDATIAGTRGSDRLRGTDDDDVIAAKGGDDTVIGLRGDDLVCGRGGDDTLRGKGGDDTLRGGGGKDQLRGGAGSNRCRGGTGSDSRRHC
jgi:Ca2+-binding RTX toxin-like protein